MLVVIHMTDAYVTAVTQK